ncbi:MAG: phosphatase PAP2 family protein [Prevotellaceae bacterium]|jgi:undecaprenyl-diphosphatase|nr:phosphatase PAP2 family protein [Prevotellaceae bacterium]
MNAPFPQWDTDLFLFLNGLHADWLDPIMKFISGNFTFIPVYAVALFFFYKREGKAKLLFALLGVALCILLADRISSGLLKSLFERYRPSREPALEGLVHLVDGYRGGRFGFVSSHAANHFSFAVFSLLLVRRKVYTWFILLLALIISYSRIYLGVHYPLDIICGGLLGAGIGWTVCILYKKSLAWWEKRSTV